MEEGLGQWQSWEQEDYLLEYGCSGWEWWLDQAGGNAAGRVDGERFGRW